MKSYVIKAPPQPHGDRLVFHEKSMWRGKDIRPGDEVFIFAAEHHGGQGLCARGVVTQTAPGVGSRVHLTVQTTATVAKPLGREDLRGFRGLGGGDPGAEIDHKLYVQATNKVAGVSDAAVSFLQGFFDGPANGPTRRTPLIPDEDENHDSQRGPEGEAISQRIRADC